jgi:hypothetical protein
MVRAAHGRSVDMILSVAKLLALGFVMRMDNNGQLLSSSGLDGQPVTVEEMAQQQRRQWVHAEDAAASAPAARVCACCHEYKLKLDFSATQLKKHAVHRKCKQCVSLEHKEGIAATSQLGAAPHTASAADALAVSPSAIHSAAAVAAHAPSAASVKQAPHGPPGGAPVQHDAGQLFSRYSSEGIEEACSICMEPLWKNPAKRPLALPPCRHMFHHDCLEQAVTKQVHEIKAGRAEAINGYGATGPRGACPLCRHEISPLLWTQFAEPHWALPRNWISSVVAALVNLPQRQQLRSSGVSFSDVYEAVVLHQEARVDNTVPLEVLRSPTFLSVIEDGIREGASRYTKRRCADGTCVYYCAPTQYKLLSDNRLWSSMGPTSGRALLLLPLEFAATTLSLRQVRAIPTHLLLQFGVSPTTCCSASLCVDVRLGCLWHHIIFLVSVQAAMPTALQTPITRGYRCNPRNLPTACVPSSSSWRCQIGWERCRPDVPPPHQQHPALLL